MIDPEELLRREKLFNEGYWEVPDNLDTSNFDFSWRPEPYDRPYTHQFGTQWQKTGGPRFIVPQSEGIKYQNSQRAIKLPTRESRNWRVLQSHVSMDWSWHPDDTDPPFVYVFGNQWYNSEIMPTVQYRVSGATEKKYVENVRAELQPSVDSRSWRPLVPNCTIDFSWVPHPHDPPFIYIFGNQWYPAEIMPTYQYKVPGATEKKYINDIKATLLPDKENRAWRPLVPNSTIDYSWVPNPHDPAYIYVFGNQWYDVDLMPTFQYKVPGATEKKYITDIKATLLDNKDKWIIPDYITDFDYSWIPHPHDPPYEHQFPTEWHYTAGPRYIENNHRGLKNQDFLIAKSKTEDIVDVVEYTDSIMDALRTHEFNRPFVQFVKGQSSVNPYELIKSSDSLMHIIDGVEAIVSHRAKDTLFDKLYDYADVKYHFTDKNPELLDIVFFSNGEHCADENYQRLVDMKLPNRIVRVDGVKGRVASQHAAANSSNTEWYFLVNAKLQVNKEFDFTWQPDVLKSRRHYIFRATNPVNGLEYGHMAIVANNKTLTLKTKGRGLDFTLDSPTEVVDINSGIAIYNSSEWDTWRTAFREVIKLCYAKDSESKKRLEVWTTIGEGPFAQNSLQGAKDAVEYYESVNGDFEKLKLSYDWAWLSERFNK